MESFSAPDWRGAALNPPFCFGPNSAAAPLHRETIFAALKAGGKYFWRGGGTKKKTGRGGEKKNLENTITILFKAPTSPSLKLEEKFKPREDGSSWPTRCERGSHRSGWQGA